MAGKGTKFDVCRFWIFTIYSTVVRLNLGVEHFFFCWFSASCNSVILPGSWAVASSRLLAVLGGHAQPAGRSAMISNMLWHSHAPMHLSVRLDPCAQMPSWSSGSRCCQCWDVRCQPPTRLFAGNLGNLEQSSARQKQQLIFLDVGVPKTAPLVLASQNLWRMGMQQIQVDAPNTIWTGPAKSWQVQVAAKTLSFMVDGRSK